MSACAGRRLRARRAVAGVLDYPDVPVLVVSGELDDMTSIADGTVVAAHFPHARHVIIANGFHVNALPHARSDCGARSCAASCRACHRAMCSARPLCRRCRLVPRFAQLAGDLPAAHAERGNDASADELRLVTAALSPARM